MCEFLGCEMLMTITHKYDFCVQDLLDYFVSPEQLSGENRYHCDTCGGLQDAQRTIQILQSPSHLVLTLKRFQFNSKTGQRAKLLHRVQCSENIELSQQSYRLYAAVVHSGSSMDNGHYYTLARDETLIWRIFNDSLVAPCNPPPWSPPDTPYILFYARPEEKLQPAVDLLTLPPLQSHLMQLVHSDDTEWLKEVQNEERCRKRRKQQPSPPRASHNPDQDSDNGGNPPGGCGGGSMDVSHNRFVF
jgi:ubiquitin carboxyl-terminal hydrolase 35/38